jgi:hypothetical protein
MVLKGFWLVVLFWFFGLLWLLGAVLSGVPQLLSPALANLITGLALLKWAGRAWVRPLAVATALYNMSLLGYQAYLSGALLLGSLTLFGGASLAAYLVGFIAALLMLLAALRL